MNGGGASDEFFDLTTGATEGCATSGAALLAASGLVSSALAGSAVSHIEMAATLTPTRIYMALRSLYEYRITSSPTLTEVSCTR